MRGVVLFMTGKPVVRFLATVFLAIFLFGGGGNADQYPTSNGRSNLEPADTSGAEGPAVPSAACGAAGNSVSQASLPVQPVRAIFEESLVPPGLERATAACFMRRDGGIPAWVHPGYQTGERVALYYDPRNTSYGCGTSPYPFEIKSISVALGDSPPTFVANWPVSIRLSIYSVDYTNPTCPQPGAELCHVDVPAMTDKWPIVNPVPLPRGCCVDTSFFVVLEYTGLTPLPFPSVILDYDATTPYWQAFVYRPAIQEWMEWHYQWTQPWPGYPYLWVTGETVSNYCIDTDSDGVCDSLDNCPTIANPGQEDDDYDSLGDACDPDDDNDGVPDGSDDCWFVYNPGQEDADGDGIGDSCDVCTDLDNDGFGNQGFPRNTCQLDNCPVAYNPDQQDADGDGAGDMCDPCPLDRWDDRDHDGICSNTDNCPNLYNPDQADNNHNDIGDVCECSCPGLGDWNADGPINPLDVALMVSYVYKSTGPPPPAIPGCLAVNGDWTCDSQINPIDVVWIVNYVYKSSGVGPCDPCGQ